MQESPGLKPDWLEEINSLSVKNSNIYLATNRQQQIRTMVFFSCLAFFIWAEAALAFFPLSMHDSNISSQGFRIDSPQIFNIQILIISWTWASFGLRFFDFCNVIFSKRDCRKTVFCSFKRISRKFSIVDGSALFSKEIVKDLSFLF